jgi:translocation and assembly module TamA
MPALLFTGILLLQGCSLLPQKESAEKDTGAGPVASASGASNAAGREAFTIDVQAPDAVRDFLARNLEIQRYRRLDDLDAVEISRLMVAAEANARELLNTMGYFTPTLTLELRETPDGRAPREVRITVAPGEITRVRDVRIDFTGPIAQTPESDTRREAIRANWSLRPGQPFSQQAWDGAKSGALRNLTARRYPTGSLAASRAEIDADHGEARLSATYDSGPAYRFGPLVVRGARRYDPDAMRRIARIPTGSDYDQQQLLDAQQRLASSGYFDSVFLTLDTHETDPMSASVMAPVIAQVNEAPLQRVTLGAGITTDSGARFSIDHVHNQMPLLGWRAVSGLSIDRDTRSLGTEWSAVPRDSGWRSFVSAQLKSEVSGSYTVDSGRLRSGQSKSGDNIDRSLFAQYDYARSHGLDAPPSASAFSLNWNWTGRYFDNANAPTRGQGVALELGAGYTLTGERAPFTRTVVRWVGFVPAGRVQSDDRTQSREARIQFRAELGEISARESARIPSTLAFLTGGDTTVRGYGFRSIGTVRPDGTIIAGRIMNVASVEWQRPTVYGGRLSDWESAVFVDAGSVADKAADLKPKVGAGVGARWKSPVGPLQIDLAYGFAVRRFRLHFRFGFTF